MNFLNASVFLLIAQLIGLCHYALSYFHNVRCKKPWVRENFDSIVVLFMSRKLSLVYVNLL